MKMSKKQQDFYDKNRKKIINFRKNSNHLLADRLENVNKLLFEDKIPEALKLADRYNFDDDFVYVIKMIFAGFE